jgi:hypothetical protein
LLLPNTGQTFSPGLGIANKLMPDLKYPWQWGLPSEMENRRMWFRADNS